MRKFALLLVLYSFRLFSLDNFIVVTTIQYPTPQLRNLSQIPGWQLVVVGDKKTPKDWRLDNCIYLSPEKQLELGYQIAALLPWNHYSRKNIGYLYAIENGAKLIYETDDDNENIGEMSPCPVHSILASVKTKDDCFNIYKYFGHPEIWPRGYPLEKILNDSEFQLTEPEECFIGVEQGVVNESPDVDAIFRLTQNKEVDFEPQQPCALPLGLFCPFNSQNTYFHPIAFFTLYIPSHVSMRVSDIWRGYLSQRLIWEFGAQLIFSGPNAIQKRNPHCLLNDFILEQALYTQAGALVRFLGRWESQLREPGALMQSLFQDLIENKFLDQKELSLLEAWLADLRKVGYEETFQKSKN